jgi:hypothetical protein
MIDLSSRIDYLKGAIAMEKRAIHAHKLFAVGAFCVGLLAGALVHVLSGNALGEGSKWMLSICGPFISTGGAGYPLKEIYFKQAKIHKLRFLKSVYEKCQQNPSATDSAPLPQMQDFLDFVEKC